MKRIIQLILFLFLLIIFIIFYKIYFTENKEIKVNSLEQKDQLLIEKNNNQIKNLRYDVNFDENKQYIITAELSEIAYENEVEIVKMKKVVAIFVDETNIPLTITADQAIYNDNNYNTNFSENVKITYINNIILSDKMDLNFNTNIISIYENVEYEGLQGTIKADNVKVDLVTKKIRIYMDDKKKKVKVETR